MPPPRLKSYSKKFFHHYKTVKFGIALVLLRFCLTFALPSSLSDQFLPGLVSEGCLVRFSHSHRLDVVLVCFPPLYQRILILELLINLQNSSLARIGQRSKPFQQDQWCLLTVQQKTDVLPHYHTVWRNSEIYLLVINTEKYISISICFV